LFGASRQFEGQLPPVPRPSYMPGLHWSFMGTTRLVYCWIPLALVWLLISIIQMGWYAITQMATGTGC